MKSLLSSRTALGVAAAATSLVLLAGCDRRPTDVPPPTTGQMERDRTANPPMPSTAPAAPASSPATPAPGGTTQ